MATLTAYMATNPSAVATLSFIRDNKIRAPSTVLPLALPYFTKSPSTKEDFLAIIEQGTVAALDLAEIATATTGVAILRTLFPVSHRVDRLEGMLNEAQGNYTAAETIYQTMLKENPANLIAHKRLYCIAKATKPPKEVITALLTYLKQNQADAVAWQELAHLYLTIGDYAGAAFALEEVLLTSPLSPPTHCLLAECYVTLATTSGASALFPGDAVESPARLARRHFSEALNLKPGYVRALVGLSMASKATYGEKETRGAAVAIVDAGGVPADKEVSMALFDHAREQVGKVLKGRGENEFMAAVGGWMEEERREMLAGGE